MNNTNTLSKKFFTKEHATKTLPFVEKIISDIVGKWKHLLEMEEQEVNYSLSHMKDKAEQILSLAETKHLIHEIQYHIQELTNVGCFLQDLNKGVVVFPSVQEGKSGYLRWKLGQKKVQEFYAPDVQGPASAY